MNGNASRLALAAALLILTAVARAEDQELKSIVSGWSSNREPASEWLEIRFKDELDRPKILWCHGRKSCSPAMFLDADIDARLPLFELKLSYTQNEGSVGEVAYYESVLSEYSAVRNPHNWGFDISKIGSAMKVPASYGESNTFRNAQTPISFDPNAVQNAQFSRGQVFTIKPPELFLTRKYQYLVVNAPSRRAAGPANPMEGLQNKPDCPAMISYFYGNDNAAITGSQLVHRRLLPQEIEWAQANMPGVDLGALGYAAAMDAGQAGRIQDVDAFVKRLREATVAAAASQLADPNGALGGQRFTPFEASFLSCRTTHADVRDAFFASLKSVTPDRTPAFIARWRGFIRNELKTYQDQSGRLPAGPVPYKDALDLINARTTAFQGGTTAAPRQISIRDMVR